jgi:hypothetical protein
MILSCYFTLVSLFGQTLLILDNLLTYLFWACICIYLVFGSHKYVLNI